MLLFNIPLSVNFGQPFDPLIFKTGISPEFRYRLFHNIIAYYQFDFYFHNVFENDLKNLQVFQQLIVTFNKYKEFFSKNQL